MSTFDGPNIPLRRTNMFARCVGPDGAFLLHSWETTGHRRTHKVKGFFRISRQRQKQFVCMNCAKVQWRADF